VVGAPNRWLSALGVVGGLVSLAAISTILVFASRSRDVPLENALTVAWWGGGLTGLIIGVISMRVPSGKAALVLSTVALPIGFVVAAFTYFF
jgi:hypothetical protein